MKSINPVLVVGAGPGGLTTALTLVENGIPVRIISKSLEHLQASRAAAVMPRTIECHSLLGTLPDFLEKASLPKTCHSYARRSQSLSAQFDLLPKAVTPSPSRPYPNALILSQARHEALLRRHLKKYGVDVELGVELVHFEQYKEHVIATLRTTSEDGKMVVEHFESPYLVDASGAQSFIPHALDISSEHVACAHPCVVGDVEVLRGLDRNVWSFWGSPETIMLSLRPPEVPDSNVFSIFCSGAQLDTPWLSSSSENWFHLFRQISQLEDVEFGWISQLEHYTPKRSVATKFSSGRCFLVGDAAHGHCPVPAEGLNASIQDGINLGWKLASVLNGYSSPSLLDSYTSERAHVMAAMAARPPDLLKTITMSRHVDSAVTSSVIRKNRPSHMLGINYRACGQTVLDTLHQPCPYLESDSYDPWMSAGMLQAGDRAPDAPNLVLKGNPTPRRLFDFFSIQHHTVLILTDRRLSAASILLSLAPYRRYDNLRVVLLSRHTARHLDVNPSPDAVLIDKENHAFGAYVDLRRALTVVFVRPDGYIGGIVDEARDVPRYMSKVFL